MRPRSLPSERLPEPAPRTFPTRIALMIPVLAALACGTVPRAGHERPQPVSLADLVGRGDPLADQDLRFDARFARIALEYRKSGDLSLLTTMAGLPATAHLLSHARNFDYDVPKESAGALVRYLVAPSGGKERSAAACESSLAFFTGPMLDDPGWVHDTLRYLPAGFRFHGTLFLTFGYDIGVAFGDNASLNGAHSHFEGHPRELLYYAIHELHHVGFMAHRPPPKLADLQTRADVLRLVEYSTQLEGMAVLAAYERRRKEGALADDEDYVALQDEARMRRDEEIYFEAYEALRSRGDELADKSAWSIIDRMSSGERLWYRVGARLAQRIEATLGRSALIGLIGEGPVRFVQTGLRLRRQQESGGTSQAKGE